MSAIRTPPRETEGLDELGGALHGELLLPASVGYDTGRRIWNGAIDRRPAGIARCTGVADVIAAVRFARERDLLVAVRSGGHGVGGHALCDGGLVIDLSPMKGIHVDPQARTARAEAGVLWGELDRETQLFGLATVGGIVSHTGLSGLTLGGGIGWLMRKYGATVDNLLSVDLVTADGELVTASENENPDLFWGVRGGGGNFGIVTSFEYRLHPVGPIVLAGPIFHPLEDAPEVLRFYRELAAAAPDELTTIFELELAPPLPFLPEDVHAQRRHQRRLERRRPRGRPAHRLGARRLRRHAAPRPRPRLRQLPRRRGTRPRSTGLRTEKYDRLVELKRNYDPTNFFRLNQNIPPK